MIAEHLEPKGLSPDATPLADLKRHTRHDAARRGSRLLRDAILRLKGMSPPEEPKRIVARPHVCPVCYAPTTPKRKLIADIQETVAAYYGINPALLISDTRQRDITRVRQIAMYLSSQVTKHSIAEIGRRFNRDHTTVLHAIKEVNRRAENDTEVAFEVSLLRERLAA